MTLAGSQFAWNCLWCLHWIILSQTGPVAGWAACLTHPITSIRKLTSIQSHILWSLADSKTPVAACAAWIATLQAFFLQSATLASRIFCVAAGLRVHWADCVQDTPHAMLLLAFVIVLGLS